MADKLNLTDRQVVHPLSPSGPERPVAVELSGPADADEGCPHSSAPADAVPWLEGGQAILDANGRITEINEALSGWLDLPATSIVGRPFWNLLAERCADWGELLATLRAGTETFSERKLRLPGLRSPSAQW